MEIDKIKMKDLSLPIGVLTQSSSQKDCSLSQSSGSSQYSKKEKFFYKAEVKSLSEINDITTVTNCVTIGTIGRIIVENHGWCYASCMKCNKSVVLEKKIQQNRECKTRNEQRTNRSKKRVMNGNIGVTVAQN
ncbi:hypothetical protein JHK82_026160 [Glycine max]|uniref:Uncharacterized protein n=2 Tax=Glycine subgen. Soja TaxID=1462606 RepID=A0A0R0ID93_SOYBN|nr:hypothetical protein JHK85_026770 [Glycine max]KAG5014024.1 hypothetical protein JHK86_026285 [Glycine max]KAG5134972.1 hypothetical protein JHK82_026160 [Glycine max]RZB93804.1 hypothetical protein D0Y65_025237 [Glycine soja]